MTSIKTFKSHKDQYLEIDVKKSLQRYENYITSESLTTYIKDELPTFPALVTNKKKYHQQT